MRPVLLFLLAGVLVATPLAQARADGFTAADLASAADAGDDAARTRSGLFSVSEAMRLAIAADPASALASAPREDAERLRAALSLDASQGASLSVVRARWFMAGAIVSAYPNARRTVFYNPLARGWLVVSWTVRDGVLAIADAQLTSAGPTPWLQTDGPYLAGLVEDVRENGSLPGSAAGEFAGAEADRWITGVAMQMRDPAQRTALDRARRTIAEGRTARFGGGAIDLLPAEARATFGPVAGFDRPGGRRSAIFGSPLYPNLLIAADFDARARLTRLTLINLGAVL